MPSSKERRVEALSKGKEKKAEASSKGNGKKAEASSKGKGKKAESSSKGKGGNTADGAGCIDGRYVESLFYLCCIVICIIQYLELVKL